MRISTLSRILFISVAAVALSLAPKPAFAQHGGGHGGGGGSSHGGGGGGSHGGGGGGSHSSGARASSGGYRGGSGASRGGGYRGGAPGAYARGGAYGNRGGSSAGGYRGSTAYSGGNRAGASIASRAAGANASGWHSFGNSTNRATSSTARSFSGQGHSITSTGARSATHSIAATHGLANGSHLLATNYGNARLGTAFGPYNRGYGYGRGYGLGAGFGYPYRFGWGGGWGFGFGWGFGLGFGWGWGWGLGSPYWWPGYYGCDPYWGWGCPGSYYYNSPDYPPDYGPASSYQIDGYTSDNRNGGNNSAPDLNAQSQPAPPAQDYVTRRQAPSNSGAGQVVYLYRKDGLMFAANDYWVANNQVHYTVLNGGENTIDMRDFDVQRTIDENAKRGVDFSLRATPAGPSGDSPSACIFPLVGAGALAA